MNEEKEQTLILKEILKWIRFMGMKEVKNTLAAVLDTEEKKLVYYLSDGSRGVAEIARLVGIGSTTVFGMWQTWLKLGLGESIPVKGGSRFKRCFDLEDFGIKVPEIRAREKKEKPVEQVALEKTEKESLEGDSHA